jgi:hypothetical protein
MRNFSIYGKKHFSYNFYSECDDMYEKEIMDLRKIVANESLFAGYGVVSPTPTSITNIIDKINNLMRKMRICCHYEDNKLYMILDDLLSEIDCYKKKNILQAEIDRLKKIVQENGSHAQTFTSVNINTVIKANYTKYIIHFGVPKDGIFDPLLLAAVECMD